MRIILILLLLTIPAYGAVDFASDADDDYIALTDSADFDVGSGESFTIVAWVDSDNGDGMIYSFRNSGDDGPLIDFAVGYNGIDDNENNIVFGMRSTAGTGLNSVTSSGEISGLTFVAARFDNTNNTQDVFVGTTKTSEANANDYFITGDLIYIAIEKLWEDSDYFRKTEGRYNGRITDFYYWDIALTDEQLGQIATSKVKGIGMQIAPANLVCYLPMDEKAVGTGINGITFNDFSGNSNSGTGTDSDSDSLFYGETVISYPPKVGVFQ